VLLGRSLYAPGVVDWYLMLGSFGTMIFEIGVLVILTPANLV
jgi:hypothetical protein